VLIRVFPWPVLICVLPWPEFDPRLVFVCGQCLFSVAGGPRYFVGRADPWLVFFGGLQ